MAIRGAVLRVTCLGCVFYCDGYEGVVLRVKCLGCVFYWDGYKGCGSAGKVFRMCFLLGWL